MRYLPLVMTLALLLNFSTVLFFKFKVARDLNLKISELSSASDRRFEAFASDVLHRVDGFLYSNVLHRVSSGVSNGNDLSPASLSPADERRLVLHEVVSSDFDYDYYFDGNPHAYLDGSVFSVGDPFPRGGVITNITRDSILVSNKYLFVRPSRNRLSSSLDLAQSKKEYPK